MNEPSQAAAPPAPQATATRGAEFHTAMAHFYRGEVSRSNTWRSRLDATTNWAVVTTGAALSFAFGGSENTPEVILIVTVLVLLFLFIEARRYRYYELWSYRVRSLENNYLAELLAGPGIARPGWEERLTRSLRQPSFPITLLEALGRRYRRNYAPLFLVLAMSWLIKLTIHPTTVTGWSDFLARSAIGPLPGWAVLSLGVIFNGALFGLGLLTVGLRKAEGEVLEDVPGLQRFWLRLREASREALEVDLAMFRPSARDGRKRLVLIISDQVEAVSRPLLTELDRGVTLIRGTGMYSGQEHGILMCVAGSRQIDRLQAIVRQNDPRAFVVVTGTQDVRGEGFRPLEA